MTEIRKATPDVVHSEAGETPPLILSKRQLIRDNFGFQALDETNLATMSGPLFSKRLYNRDRPKVVDVGGKKLIADGIHRVAAYPEEEVPVDEITAEIIEAREYDGQTTLTSEQFREELKLRMGAQVRLAPERLPLLYISEWKGIVGEAAGESSGLAALVLLGREGRDGFQDEPEAVVRRRLQQETSPLLGEPEELKETMIGGLIDLHRDIAAKDKSYDTIALKAFKAMATLAEAPGEMLQRQITGLFTLAEVDRKITDDGTAQDTEVTQRRSVLLPLLTDAVIQAAENTDENESFREALLERRLSYDDLLFVLTPDDDLTLLRDRYEAVKGRVNTRLLKTAYATKHNNGQPSDNDADQPSDEIVQIMRNLNGKEILDEAAIESTVTFALPLADFIAETRKLIDELRTTEQESDLAGGLEGGLELMGRATRRQLVLQYRKKIGDLRDSITHLQKDDTDASPQAGTAPTERDEPDHHRRPASRPAASTGVAHRPAYHETTAYRSAASTGEEVVLVTKDALGEGTAAKQTVVVTQAGGQDAPEEQLSKERQIRILQEAMRLMGDNLKRRDETITELETANGELTATAANQAATIEEQGATIVDLTRENAELLAERDKLKKQEPWWEKIKDIKDIEDITDEEKRAVQAHSMGQGRTFRDREGISEDDYGDLLKSAWEKRSDYLRALREQRQREKSQTS